MICKEIVRLNNRLGLHLRASAELVKIASKFKSRIKISKGPVSVNGKSIMALLTLAVAFGMNVTIIADGDDAQQAMEAIKLFLENRFVLIA